MSRYIDADLVKDKIEERLLFRAKDVERLLDDTPTADVKPVRQGHWILEAKHWFNDYGECLVYVVALCSECKKVWHNDRTVFDRVLYDYNNDDTPNPITEERIKRCKEYCLQEAEKCLLIESPFCEKCDAKMDGKETEQ